jgi:RNA polymerase sigma-70 factor (ECF subfamily)
MPHVQPIVDRSTEREPGELVEDTFEAFFRAEHLRLQQAMYAVTGSQSEAEELTQEAFVRVWERWDRVSRLERPVGYLYRTAMNAFRSRIRRASVAARRATGLLPRDDDYDRADQRDAVTRAMAQLPDRQRAAIVLTEFLELDSREAGRVLGVASSTIRNLTAQARAALRRSLENADG